MEGFDDVSAESSTATTESAEQSSPGATDQAQAQQAERPAPFHTHPRWQEMVNKNRGLEGQVRQLTQAMQQLQQARNSGNAEAPLTEQEQQAIAVLEKLIGRSTKLNAMMKLAEKAPQFETRMEGLSQSEAARVRAHTSAARASVKEMVVEAGLPTDDASLKHIVALVARQAAELPDGNERYASGDFDVLREAFEQMKPWFTALRKPAEQATAQTKTRTRQLPPPARGAAAGPAAPKPLQPGKEREFESDMHSRARKMLEGLSQG